MELLKIAHFNSAAFTASNIFIGFENSYPSATTNGAVGFGLVDSRE